MSLPFSRQQFFDVFATYNTAVWPVQLVLVALAAACVVLLMLGRGQGRVVGAVLAGLWLWCGVAYHLVLFTRINGMAWAFGAAFVVAGGLLLKHTLAGSLRFEQKQGLDAVAGGALVAYALVGYPLLGALTGHEYPRTPTFGLPCPLTIFTLGLLLFARRPAPAAVFVVPLAWSALGTVAATQLGVAQDYGLFAAGLITVAVLLARRRRVAPRRRALGT